MIIRFMPILVALVFAAVLAIMPARAIDLPGRTLYDRVGSSPDAAVTSFLDAWTADDFVTVAVNLSPKSLQAMRQTFAREFSYRRFFAGDPKAVDEGTRFLTRGAYIDDLANDPLLLFDDVMMAAKRANRLPFTLASGRKVARRQEAANGDLVYEVDTGAGGSVSLNLTRIPTGLWKVDSISFPGSDPAAKPWGYPQP